MHIEKKLQSGSRPSPSSPSKTSSWTDPSLKSAHSSGQTSASKNGRKAVPGTFGVSATPAWAKPSSPPS